MSTECQMARGACGGLWEPPGEPPGEPSSEVRARPRGQSSHSVREWQRSQARTAIPCETAADLRLKRQFCVGVATIRGQKWRQFHTERLPGLQEIPRAFLGSDPQS